MQTWRLVIIFVVICEYFNNNQLMKTHNRLNAFCVTEWRVIASCMLIVCLVGLQLSCATSPDTPELVLKEHLLVGKIWDVKQRAFIDKETLNTRSLESEYLLIGERHDNLVHHQHQTWFIQQLEKKPLQVSVAFEMIDNEQGIRLAKRQINSVEELISELKRSKTSWEYEQRYKSLFAETLAAGYKINSANLNSKQLMQTVKKGELNLPVAYKRMLNKTGLSAEQNTALLQDINASHCNMLDDKTTSKMALAQRMRDSIMAHSLLKSGAQVKVLIAGIEHVRKDRGVPLYLQTNLQTQTKPVKILSIGLLEVELDMSDPLAYAEYWDDHTLPFDIVWFTPQVAREDACAELLKHFKPKS